MRARFIGAVVATGVGAVVAVERATQKLRQSKSLRLTKLRGSQPFEPPGSKATLDNVIASNALLKPFSLSLDIEDFVPAKAGI